MFPKRLKTARDTAGLSQSKLASMLNVSQATVGMWEGGRREPNFSMLVTISNKLNVTVCYLLGISDRDEQVASSVLSDTEQRLLYLFRDLSPQGKDYIFQQLNIAAQVYTKNASVPNVGTEAG